VKSVWKWIRHYADKEQEYAYRFIPYHIVSFYSLRHTHYMENIIIDVLYILAQGCKVSINSGIFFRFLFLLLENVLFVSKKKHFIKKSTQTIRKFTFNTLFLKQRVIKFLDKNNLKILNLLDNEKISHWICFLWLHQTPFLYVCNDELFKL